MDMLDIVARYQEGQRDFRGADLRGGVFQNAALPGIDLSRADLRGANFSGTTLVGAQLREAKCGARWHWVYLRWLLQVVAGGFSGWLMAFVTIFLAALPPKELAAASPLLVASNIVLLRLGLWLWLQYWSRSSHASLLVSILSTAAVLLAGYVPHSFVGSAAIAVISSLLLALGCASTLAATVTLAGAGTSVGASSVAVASVVVGAVVGGGDGTIGKALARGGFAYTVVCVDLIISQFVAAWLIRRRALAGAPEYAWVRDFAVALRCLGGTDFWRANLRQADFRGAELGGTDLRDAILEGAQLRDARGLDWARLDAGDLRKLQVQRLLTSGSGVEQNFSGIRFAGLSLRRADLTKARLQGADLGGVDLTDARLDGAILDAARIDRRTYERSGWSPPMLAELHQRGVEVVSLETFPPAAQDVVVGLRDGLVLLFAEKLTHFRQHLLEGSLYAIVGLESGCRIAEYREKGDGTSFVRIVGTERQELERVAEAFYRRVWEESNTSSAHSLARRTQLLSDELRQRLSQLVGELLDIELRLPVNAEVGNLAVVHQASKPPAASDPVWNWDQRTDRVTFAHRPATRLVILHAPSTIDTALCAELLKHLEVLRSQGLLETFHSVPPGKAVAATFNAELGQADLVLVLLSSELLADSACQDRLQVALEAEQGTSRTMAVPVVLRPCLWDASPLGGRQAIPESGRAVTEWGKSASERDAAWVEVTSAIRRLLLSTAGG